MARESDFRKFGKQMSALALMGVGCRDIAWLYGCNARTVRSLLREHGVDPMPPARQVSAWFSALRRRNIEPIGDVLPHEDLLALGIVDGSANPNGTGRVDYAVVEKLISGGLGIPAIARYFGVSKAAVYEGLKRRGHTFRNQIQNSK